MIKETKRLMNKKGVTPSKYAQLTETITQEQKPSFLRDIIDKIIKHYNELNEARDFDKQDEKKEKVLRAEVKRILDLAISSHTTERAIEDRQPFTDYAFKKNILATVGFDLSISAMSKIMIFQVDRNQIKKIQTIEKKGLIILSLELNENANYLYTGGFKSGVGLWKFNEEKSEFEFQKTLGFGDHQIRSVFWSEPLQVLFVKRRFEDRPYDEIFGYIVQKSEESFEEVVFEQPFKSLETMMDKDAFSIDGKYFVMSLPDSKDSRFSPSAFFSMHRPRRREKKVVLLRFYLENKTMKPVLRLNSLSGKIVFIENCSHFAFLREEGPIMIYKIPQEGDTFKEAGIGNENSLFEEGEEIDESKAFTFKGVTQSQIDSFDLNESDEMLALTERNKMYVYEIEDNWECTLLMEYEDEVVMNPPILSICFSTDSNFILCRGHQKIVIVDIYGKQKMQQISTLRGIESMIKPIMHMNKLIKKNSKVEDDTPENHTDEIESHTNEKELKKEDAAEEKFDPSLKLSVINSNPNQGTNIGKRFEATHPVFYYSTDETCIMAVDESMHKLNKKERVLSVCRWTGINKNGNDQTGVRSKILNFKLPDDLLARVIDVNDDNTAVVLSVINLSDIQKKVAVTEIIALAIDEKNNSFNEIQFGITNSSREKEQQTNPKYFKAKFLHNSKSLLTLDVEFNPKIWEFNPNTNSYTAYNILEGEKLNFTHSVLSFDNRYLITEYKKKISFWKLDINEKKHKYNFTLDQKIELSEASGDVKALFITKNKKMVIVQLKPIMEGSSLGFQSKINPNTVVKVYLRDSKNNFCLIQTESIPQEFNLLMDINSEFLFFKYEELTEIWRIHRKSLCYEGTLPNFEYDQISPSFSRILRIENQESDYLYFKLLDLRHGFLQVEKNMKTLYMLKELFNTETGVINSKAIEIFLDNSSDFGTNKTDEIQQLHSKLSLLLITTFTSNARLLQTVLNEIDYIPFFYEKGYDPVDFALTMGHIDSLDELTRYFKINSSGRTNPIISYLNIERLSKCMETYNQSFREFVIEYFLEEAVLSSEDIELVDSFPLKESGYEIVECWTRFLDKKLAKKIMKVSEKNFLQKKDPVKVKLLTTSFAINTNIVFNSNTLLLESIENLPNELIVGNIRHILRYIWKKNWYIVAIFAFFNWINYALFILFILFFQDTKILGILNIILSVIFLVFELMMANRDWARWARDNTNFYDIIQFTAMPTITFLNFIGVDDYSKILFNFLVNMTILVAGYRSLLKVKIFWKVRYMVDMVRQVFSDIIGFGVIFGISILYFTFIGINSSRATSIHVKDIDNVNDFLTILDSYYNVAFGDFSILFKEHWSHAIHYMTTTVFLALVMFNLMAATIWETFGNFQKKKTLVDLRSISSILVDYTHLFSYISSFGCMIRLDKKGLKYLCLIVPQDDHSGIQEELRGIKKDIEDNREELGAISSKIGQDIRGLDNNMDDVKTKLDKVDMMEDSVLKVEGKVDEVIRMLKDLKKD